MLQTQTMWEVSAPSCRPERSPAAFAASEEFPYALIYRARASMLQTQTMWEVPGSGAPPVDRNGLLQLSLYRRSSLYAYNIPSQGLYVAGIQTMCRKSLGLELLLSTSRISRSFSLHRREFPLRYNIPSQGPLCLGPTNHVGQRFFYKEVEEKFGRIFLNPGQYNGFRLMFRVLRRLD